MSEKVDRVQEEVTKMRQTRKAVVAGLLTSIEVAIHQLENGSFPEVEQALMECSEDVCSIEIHRKEAVAQKRKRRRRPNGSAVQATTR